MDRICCRDCTNPDCNGCNLFRLYYMLETKKLDGLMDKNRAIQTNINAIPKQHGQWIFYHYELYGCYYECSNCKYESNKKTNFCPNCGAKMDKGGDEDG